MATPAQRQELLRRDGYRCSTPGCPNILWLHVHHIVFHCDGGVTVPQNLCILCAACHRNIHGGHLHLSGEAPHCLVWRDEQGRRLGYFEEVEPADWLSLWLDTG